MWIVLAFISVVSIAAVGFVIWPLFRPHSTLILSEGEEGLAELLTRKDATLQAIKDLEFDHNVGKIEDADFEYFNQILRRRAVLLLQRIERYAPQTAQLEETLEVEIAARRRVNPSDQKQRDH